MGPRDLSCFPAHSPSLGTSFSHCWVSWQEAHRLTDPFTSPQLTDSSWHRVRSIVPSWHPQPSMGPLVSASRPHLLPTHTAPGLLRT